MQPVISAPARAVLFDLDGTLVDSVGDLASAANRMLAGLGLPPRLESEIRDFVGKGTTKLVERCLTGHSVDFATAMTLFERAYREESDRHSRLYPGVLTGLGLLEKGNVLMGCVTNKPGEFTEPLLAAMGLRQFFTVVVAGDTVAKRKPDPLPFEFACSRLQVKPADAVVIGDSANDAQGARAAGCRIYCVPYGYREGLPIESIACDGIVPDIATAARWVLDANNTITKGNQ